jgi:DHA2 family multidrug resistance protein
MVLDRGHDLDWLDSNMIVGLIVIAVVGLAAFLIWELTDDHPVVNLRIFRYRGFAVGTAVTSIGFAVFFGSVLLSPLWLQTAMGYTQTWAATTSVFTAGVGVVAMPFVAMFLHRVDSRPVIFIGLLGMSAAYLWRGQFNSEVTFGQVVLSQVFIGSGMSLVFVPALTMALGSVKPQELASAAGIVAFVRTASMAFSAAITTTRWQDGMTINRAGIVDRLADATGVNALAAAGFAHDKVPWHLDRIVQEQAVMLATNDVYYMFAAIVTVGAFVIWLAPRVRPRPKAA